MTGTFCKASFLALFYSVMNQVSASRNLNTESSQDCRQKMMPRIFGPSQDMEAYDHFYNKVVIDETNSMAIAAGYTNFYTIFDADG